ncbi:MAG: type IX secretion system membrane protein PorP/SprF [Bacteroidota bacterium]
MKKLFMKVAIAIAGFTGVAVAQQDPQFTQFMHNKLIYNPGYAGTSNAICGVLQFRQQWAGFTGSPQSFALSADAPIPGLPLGVGLNVMTDKIGPMTTTFLRVAGAFNKKIGPGTLGIGIDLGMIQKKITATWIPPELGKIDPSIPGAYSDALSNPDFGKAAFDVGFGAFYQIPNNFYVGLSSTHLPAQEIKDGGSLKFQVSRHYYFMAGKTFQINKWNKITPNVLVKSDMAASAVDLNLTYMWSDMVWIGGSYRVGTAAAVMLGYQTVVKGTTTIKVGYSYDFAVTSEFKKFGSHEIIAGVCFAPKIKKTTTYSNDRFLD